MPDAPIGVAVIDSGASVPHPHLPCVAGGVAIDMEGNESSDYSDRLGHGTAAAAAIHEKAPDAEISAVKVFDRELANRGMRLVNLSLGTPNDFREAELAPAVERAVERGTIIVSAHEHDGRLWFPGSMDGVVGVVMDAEHPRDSVSVVDVRTAVALSASGYPRPIPGVPPERNLNGISFAVANATGVLASLLAAHPKVRSAEAAMELVRSHT